MNANFKHLAPELRLYGGDDSLGALASELERLGRRRAVVICGRSVASTTAMELLRQTLGPVLVGECTAAQSNSPLPGVEAGARALKALEADSVIAVGGGSAAVTARAASILLAEKRSARDLCTSRRQDGVFHSPRLEAPKLPQFVVPTTPSTAFVKAGSAVQDPATGQRLALFDPKTRAKAIFLHPAFLATSPESLVRSASLNSLCTAIEALESPRCDPISEAMLMHSLRLTVRHLHRLSTASTQVREQLVVAAVLCGRGTEKAGGGLASVLGHAIGHRSHVDNGVVNTIVLPHTIRFNSQSSVSSIAEVLLEASAAERTLPLNFERAVEVLESVFDKLSVPRRLRDVGVARADLGAIAEAAMADWFVSRNARRITGVGDVMDVLQAAW